MQKFWETSINEPTELEAISMRRTGLLSMRIRESDPQVREEMTREIQDLEDKARAMGARYIGTKRL